ncbi:hypothetical protein Ngar_c27640 [Candidatus Nitrososphaera gargensis Ga9.2]|uniref:Uncharacterized protein n=1 Tax=Nitrososphaera gargensis (strain Ga9.2) TaxID=1237085 RepID=K0IIE6_NITGG|nr:hypothetical protein [Candidatus Nitrososphaera gargensis]AFU59685.1 hypothetical protein Ngar_c27640 [Candidatus Nitrososphaera gargensis Ga9.2]
MLASEGSSDSARDFLIKEVCLWIAIQQQTSFWQIIQHCSAMAFVVQFWGAHWHSAHLITAMMDYANNEFLDIKTCYPQIKFPAPSKMQNFN